MKNKILNLAKDFLKKSEYDIDSLILLIQNKLGDSVSYRLIRALLVPLFESTKPVKLISKYHLLESSIDKKYFKYPETLEYIKAEIEQMVYEIEQSEAGVRRGKAIINPKDNDGYIKYINLSKKSTFPEYLQDIFNGSGTKKKFLSAVKRGKGKVYDRIMQVAIDRLENGYKNLHGYDYPNQDFIDTLVPF